MNEDLSKLNLVELLELLEPVPEPPPIPLWPATQGWIWLGVSLLAVVLWLVRIWVLKRRTNAYRRAALREISVRGENAAALANILRRTALAAYPRQAVAGLYGEDWLAFLDRTYGGTGFLQGPGRVIAFAPYTDQPSPHGLAVLAGEWVRRHRKLTDGGK